MGGSYVIGCDGGTESLRAGVFDLSGEASRGQRRPPPAGDTLRPRRAPHTRAPSLAAGKPLAFASCPYTTQFPHPGWAEQAPRDWWAALGSAVRAAVAEAAVPLDSIAAIACDTTNCTVVALDAGTAWAWQACPGQCAAVGRGCPAHLSLTGERCHPLRAHPHNRKPCCSDGQPLRPALLWMDMRSADQAAQVLATGDAALQVNSGGRGPVSAEWMVGKALWIRQHEPAVYQVGVLCVCRWVPWGRQLWLQQHTQPAPHPPNSRTHTPSQAATYICEYQDYLNFHMTGRMAASISNVSVRWHYNSRSNSSSNAGASNAGGSSGCAGGWPRSLLAKLGVDDLLGKWPQEVLPLGAPVGRLTAA
jgi:sugar (pentulose or hexulose) kinase